MTLRIPMYILLVAAVFAALGAGVAVGLIVWEPWNGSADKDFTMNLDTDDDFQEAVQRMEAFFPDFDCLGVWDDELSEGVLGCEAGLTGFSCEFESPPAVVCEAGEILGEGFPACVVQGRTLVQCSGPNTDSFCRVRFVGRLATFVLTCQKS